MLICLRDRQRVPRRWWFPIERRTDQTLQIDISEVPDYWRDAVLGYHKALSQTLRLSSLSVVSLTSFCLLTAGATPDSSLLSGSGDSIRLPWVEAKISFLAFGLVGPVLILGATMYLQLFYGFFIGLQRDASSLDRENETQPPLRLQLSPTIFALPGIFARTMALAIVYWVTPLTLALIAWKFAGRPDAGRPVFFIAGIASLVQLFLWIRRQPEAQRSKNRLWWTIALIVVCVNGYGLFNPRFPHRSLDLTRTVWNGAWLPGADLRSASAQYTSFERANLIRADLSSADLRWSNLRFARLALANLEGVNLSGISGAAIVGALLGIEPAPGANLEEADLRAANLTRSILLGAIFRNANLHKAKLTDADAGADFEHADLSELDFTGSDLRSANLAGASLNGAHLRGARLGSARVEGATFRDADLRGVNLSGVQGLTAAQLAGAKLNLATRLPPGLERN